MSPGIQSRLIHDTPLAIIDFETTGLTAGHDRVVEVAVVRIDSGTSPRLVFDTLVNPMRPMGATDIHGITDADVARAPTFEDIAGGLVAATAGCVVAAYNVYFDIRFLGFEMANIGVRHLPPHFCLMHLRPMLGLGRRCSLKEACNTHGVPHSDAHTAAADAVASGGLFLKYLPAMTAMGIKTYGDLANLKRHKFLKSFHCLPFPLASEMGLGCSGFLTSRSAATRTTGGPQFAAGAPR